jgi:hypothetical protein
MLYIGIITGEETGFAVWDNIKRKLDSAELIDFWQGIEKLNNFKKRGKSLKVIIKSVRNRRNKEQEETIKIMQEARIKASSTRDYEHYKTYCEKNEIDFEIVEAAEKPRDVKLLRSLTGIKIESRKQVKEAVQLVFGK